MNTIKLHYTQYPANGFGKKCGKYYLIDAFGNTFDIVEDYDDVLDELFYRVNDPKRILPNSSELYAETPMKVIEKMNELDWFNVTIW